MLFEFNLTLFISLLIEVLARFLKFYISLPAWRGFINMWTKLNSVFTEWHAEDRGQEEAHL